MIDAQTVKNVYQSFEIIDLAIIRSEPDIFDALTKVKVHSALINFFNSKKLFSSYKMLAKKENTTKVPCRLTKKGEF